MSQYVAIVEDAGPDKAIGLWFPDLPGCFSAGDTPDEAIRNAQEALALYADAVREGGGNLAQPRTLADLKLDSEVAADIRAHMVALIAFPASFSSRAA